LGSGRVGLIIVVVVVVVCWAGELGAQIVVAAEHWKGGSREGGWSEEWGLLSAGGLEV